MNLWYDTETTGFVHWGKRSTDPCQPRIVQLAAVLENDGVVVREMNRYIGGIDGFGREVPAECTIEDALEEFWGMVTEADTVRAWNERFDGRMIRIELLRMGRTDLAEAWDGRPAVDVRVGNRTLGGTHDAMEDVRLMMGVCMMSRPKRRVVEVRRRWR